MTVQTVAPKVPRDPGRAWTVAAVLVVDALIVGWLLFADSGRIDDDTVSFVNVVLSLVALGGMFPYLVVRSRPGPARLVPRQDRLVAPPGRMPLVFASSVVL